MNTEKKNTFPDRANLTPEQSARLDAWVEQVKQSTQGALKISKSDLVNFCLECKPNEFSEAELIQLEMKFYNESKWIAWASCQIKSAAQIGQKLTLEELLKQRNERWEKVKKLPVAHKSSSKALKAKDKLEQYKLSLEPTLPVDLKGGP